MEIIDSDDIADDEEEGELRPGPLWRHALWVLGITVCAVGAGWVASWWRLGPEDYGIPSAAPGPVWPLLAVCGAIGLAATTLLRATAARIILYAPGRVGFVLVMVGTRLALGFRPEPPVLAAGAVAVVLAAAVWCGYGAWTHRSTTPAVAGAVAARPPAGRRAR
ncbi:hypothetical protein DEJ50_16935 [Streptomyces venezuelae]|uniref:Uncharacterized protein n=2 Tax=Streptomyces venezuelae TaxID=54571 RepID=A0A5P2D7X4_STRVZ|nr:hypothetical protein DEJ50_16935 [Streptomyces venezuelae]